MFHGVIVSGWWHSVSPVTYGFEVCKSGHTFGPAIREYYLLHYVLDGEGEFFCHDGAYRLGKGDLFVIRPGEVTTYRADKQNPWSYVWLSFTCDRQIPILESPVLRNPPVRHLFETLQRCGSQPEMDGRIFSLTYDLLWTLERSEQKKPSGGTQYAVYAKTFLDNEYMRPVTMQALADSLHIDRRYLTALFRAQYGVAPQTYLMELRLERAREFLRQGSRVSDAAAMAGFTDAANFSRKYKQRFGVSPVKDLRNVSKS